jgi:hypothetical protein
MPVSTIGKLDNEFRTGTTRLFDGIFDKDPPVVGFDISPRKS